MVIYPMIDAVVLDYCECVRLKMYSSDVWEDGHVYYYACVEDLLCWKGGGGYIGYGMNSWLRS